MFRFNHQTKHELTDKIRQTNAKFDQMRDASTRLNYMKTFFLPKQYPTGKIQLFLFFVDYSNSSKAEYKY